MFWTGVVQRPVGQSCRQAPAITWSALYVHLVTLDDIASDAKSAGLIGSLVPLVCMVTADNLVQPLCSQLVRRPRERETKDLRFEGADTRHVGRTSWIIGSLVIVGSPEPQEGPQIELSAIRRGFDLG